MTITASEVTLAATDGFRISVRKAVLSNPVRPVTAIIPGRALSELARIAADGEDTLTMVVPPGRGQVIFHLKEAELVSQLIDGNFPPYQAIVPKAFKTHTILSTAQLLKACKQAEIFAREGSNVARLDIKSAGDLEPGAVEISAQSEETGSNETIVAATIEGVGLLIAFNVKYMREVLEVIKSPNVALETSAANAPGVVRPVGDDNFLHVIMPMHLG